MAARSSLEVALWGSGLFWDDQRHLWRCLAYRTDASAKRPAASRHRPIGRDPQCVSGPQLCPCSLHSAPTSSRTSGRCRPALPGRISTAKSLKYGNSQVSRHHGSPSMSMSRPTRLLLLLPPMAHLPGRAPKGPGPGLRHPSGSDHPRCRSSILQEELSPRRSAASPIAWCRSGRICGKSTLGLDGAQFQVGQVSIGYYRAAVSARPLFFVVPRSGSGRNRPFTLEPK